MLIGHEYCTVWAVHMFVLSFALSHLVTFALILRGVILTGGLFTGGSEKAKRHHDGESCLVTGHYVGNMTEILEESEIS